MDGRGAVHNVLTVNSCGVTAVVGGISQFASPAEVLAQRLGEALNPDLAPAPLRDVPAEVAEEVRPIGAAQRLWLIRKLARRRCAQEHGCDPCRCGAVQHVFASRVKWAGDPPRVVPRVWVPRCINCGARYKTGRQMRRIAYLRSQKGGR